MIARPIPLGRIGRALRRERVVALIGPRQSGKTTLARQIQDPRSPNYFDLEDPAGLALLDEPMTALSQLRGVIVIDEVQRRPDLFPVLRVLADRRPLPARFLILGSASPQLLRQSSETLAGRLETIVLPAFSLAEVEAKRLDRHWRRGGFPRSFLSRSEEDSTAWRGELVQTFLERDLPQMGITIPATTLLRFWTMLAHYHGAVWKASELARSLGTSEPTVRRYLDLLSGAFMVRQLPPWHENLRKRQVKSPSHPKCGASWEGYAIEEVLKLLQPTEAYFWATHQGAELDLLLFKGGRRFGFEVKRADAPRITPSMRIALDDLGLEHLTVLYPGDVPYELGERISVVPLSSLARLKADQLLPKRRRSRTQASRRSTPSTRR